MLQKIFESLSWKIYFLSLTHFVHVTIDKYQSYCFGGQQFVVNLLFERPSYNFLPKNVTLSQIWELKHLVSSAGLIAICVPKFVQVLLFQITSFSVINLQNLKTKFFIQFNFCLAVILIKRKYRSVTVIIE